jgi:hypothetical protein
VVLSWEPGAFANTHDVYFGTSFEDVSTASLQSTHGVLAKQGLSVNSYDPPGLLEFGTTYYWRIDEVNAPPDLTTYKGPVWSFTVEPVGYPIANVVATASSSAADKGMTPDKTVDGSGLNADDEHGTEEADMWLTAMGAPGPAWIQYEFDKDYKLHELWVWNSNQTIEDFIGFGAKDVTVEYSLDGVEWSLLGDVEFAKAPGTDGYGDYNTVDMLGVHARFVRLTINSNWSEYMPQTGLSEVRFFRIPVRAREPQPVADATSVAVDSVLSWRAGREAAAHEVHWGMDEQAVIDGTAEVEITTESRLTPGSMDYGQTYYWKVNEVNEAATPDTWEGDLWSFSTAEYRVIEDFESYSNEVGQRAFEVWIDGIGFTLPEPGHPGNGTGAAVGHDIWTAGGPHFEKTIMETDNVHGGLQAMPLYYDNTGTPASEAQYTFAAEDWTADGLKSLSLYFCGAADNSGDLYVKINDFKVPYNGDTTDITRGSWQPWNIDLSSVQTDLTNVTQLVIGVGGAAATGVLLIDDIRLYPREPEFITPADPGRTGLLAEYLFDNSAADTSGNGHDGTLRDNARVSNGALLLDGTTDSVAIPRIGGADATFDQCTYSMWIYSTVEPASVDFCGGINSDGWSAGGIHCKLRRGMANAGINGLAGGDMQGDTVAGAEEWVHLALTVSDTVATIYLNGQVEDSRGFAAPLTMILGNGSIGAWNNNGDIQRELTGQMDDVSIYDRALSQEEVLWLAGKRAPVHKAF